MNIDFSGKHVLVTGAADGIGKATAQAFALRGAKLSVTTRSKRPLWCKNSNITHHAVDFTDDQALEDFCSQLRSQADVDIVINNAGVLKSADMASLKKEDWQEAMTVNVYAPWRITQAVVEGMRQRRWGRIIHISSIAALVNRPGAGAYAAGKAGILGLTRAMAMDTAKDGILVNALCPGHTQTPMMERLNPQTQEILRAAIPLGRFAQAEEMAMTIVFLASDLNTYMTGQTIIVDGGVTIQ